MTSKLPIPPVADEPTQEPQEAPDLPDRPEFEPVAPVTKPHRNVLLLASLLALALLAGAGFGGYRFYLGHQAKPTAAKTATQVNQTPANTAPPVEAAAFGNIKAAYVTLPLTKDQSFVSPIYGTGSIVVTANGHYLIRDPRGYTFNSKGNTGGNLLYDGKSVYDGPYLWQFALSANGQHYIYQLDTVRDHRGGNAELFVDGKLVQTVPGADSVYYPQVSNDGKHYAYATVKAGAAGDPYLVKDGTTLYTSTESINKLNFDADLQHYIVVADPLGGEPGTHQVVFDGQSLNTSQPSGLAINVSAVLSPNGQHVLYAAAGGALYLDGRRLPQTADYAGSAAAVTDSGAYGMVNWVADRVTTSRATHSIPSQFANVCSSGCDAAYPTFALSNNGQHYIFGTQQPSLWNIDGSAVKPEGSIEGAEFIGDTLYLYRWAQ